MHTRVREARLRGTSGSLPDGLANGMALTSYEILWIGHELVDRGLDAAIVVVKRLVVGFIAKYGVVRYHATMKAAMELGLR